jgi:hypothetical protein
VDCIDQAIERSTTNRIARIALLVMVSRAAILNLQNG